jgi:hypothetical protein
MMGRAKFSIVIAKFFRSKPACHMWLRIGRQCEPVLQSSPDYPARCGEFHLALPMCHECGADEGGDSRIYFTNTIFLA